MRSEPKARQDRKLDDRSLAGFVGLLLWLLPLAFLALFYFYPLASIFQLSFSRHEASLLLPFIQALSSNSIRSTVFFTFWQAALSTSLTLLIGLPGAYLLARFVFPGKSLLRALTGIPFVLPTLVVAAAFNALLGPSGWINLGLMEVFNLGQPPIRFINSLSAILVAHVFYNTTIVLRMVGDFWANLDPRLNAAARTLGATRWQALRHVTLPLLAPAILSAALLTFIFNFTSFGVILVLGGPQFATMEVEIYYQTISLFNLPLAGALSLLQLVFTLLLTILYTRLAQRVTKPVPLQARASTQRPPANRWQRLSLLVTIGALVLLFILPLLALASRSLVGFGVTRPGEQAVRGLTLAFYQNLNRNPQGSIFFVTPLQAVINSLRFAGITVLLALLLGLPAAWSLAYNRRSFLNRILDPLLMLPLGTSAVTLGLGFIVALDSPPLAIRTSPILIPIAHTLVAFPFVVRSLTPALRSIQPRLRQAAAMLGASPRQVIRHVDLPLIGRALIVAAAFAFTISMGEFGATTLIARPENPTLPVVIFRFLSRPGSLNYGQALALSTILMLVTGAGMLAIERFRVADVGEF